jgi:ubiquinone/menaquinone biosynthesis C-methylase UbiE
MDGRPAGAGAPGIANTSMDRDVLLSAEGAAFVRELDALARELERRGLPVTSWLGALPDPPLRPTMAGLRLLVKKLRRGRRGIGPGDLLNRGGADYEPLPGVSNDARHPWFLYWEAFWATRRGPKPGPGLRVLDAGGTASLFSNYLASLGAETHSIDLNPALVEAGRQTAAAMGWDLHSYAMDIAQLDFPDGHFDHAYSICVFEHLEAELRQRALKEIARVLKPGGILSLTFDYGAPAVFLASSGQSRDPEQLIRTPEDVQRHFFGCEAFEPVGGPVFHDNGKRYLALPREPDRRYTFGAVFLERVTGGRAARSESRG